MIVLRAAALALVLLLGGCVAGSGPHADPRGRCQDAGPPGTADAGMRSLFFLFCIQSP